MEEKKKIEVEMHICMQFGFIPLSQANLSKCPIRDFIEHLIFRKH